MPGREIKYAPVHLQDEGRLVVPPALPPTFPFSNPGFTPLGKPGEGLLYLRSNGRARPSYGLRSLMRSLSTSHSAYPCEGNMAKRISSRDPSALHNPAAL